MGLPAAFEGVIYDTASISTLHALAAAREAAVPGVREHGLAGRSGLGGLRVYCSEHAHSSVDKAVILLGLGQRVAAAHRRRRRSSGCGPTRCATRSRRTAPAACVPLAVVATIGTTSTTSVDPVREIADDLRARRTSGCTSMPRTPASRRCSPSTARDFDGWEHADSIVVNPHKWLFTPFDLSAFYCRRMDVVRQAFSLVPDYLRTAEGSRGVRNLMDTGVQLGRRFRALKLWMILRHFGADGIRTAIARAHPPGAALRSMGRRRPRLRARRAGAVQRRLLPRAATSMLDDAGELDAFNKRLLDAVNATGDVFLSHTRLDGRLVLRLAIGHLRTTEQHVARAWELLREHTAQLAASSHR